MCDTLQIITVELQLKTKIFLFCFRFSLVSQNLFSQAPNWKQEQELMNIHTYNLLLHT